MNGLIGHHDLPVAPLLLCLLSALFGHIRGLLPSLANTALAGEGVGKGHRDRLGRRVPSMRRNGSVGRHGGERTKHLTRLVEPLHGLAFPLGRSVHRFICPSLIDVQTMAFHHAAAGASKAGVAFLEDWFELWLVGGGRGLNALDGAALLGHEPVTACVVHLGRARQPSTCCTFKPNTRVYII